MLTQRITHFPPGFGSGGIIKYRRAPAPTEAATAICVPIVA
jgi:hypothetical protein